MHLLNIFTDYGFIVIIAIILFAFVAGFIDAVVGGGGLIQLPVLLISFPKLPIPTLFGITKIASLSGTSMAAYHYSKRIKFNYKLLFITALFAAIASYSGAKTVSLINPNTLKPLVLVILVVIALYTFFKKDLGATKTKHLAINKQYLYGALIGLIVGFYDGFFGPGTGSFLVLGFVLIIGFEFVEASAYSKIINCVTNFSALIIFIKQGNYILEIAVLMAVANMSGNIVGAKMALKKGNGFVRIIFLIIVSIMIVRYAYDVFVKF
ncbi:MAG: TSUP family transporter [Bacteroidetes bacterium]|nr:TSUP family transporter [Bacteroidota bacterium]